MSERYNGWTNYETWCVKLHMDNEECSQRYWERETKEALRNFEGPEDAADRLADYLKDWHEEELAACKAPGVYGDLLRAAMSEVNWHEIARNLVEDYAHA